MPTATPAGTVWRVEAVVPTEAVGATEAALDPFCPALTIFETEEDSGIWRLEGYTETEPDLAEVKAALVTMADIQGLAVPDVTVEAVPPRDWVAENLQTFEPLNVGRYYVYGSHVTDRPPFGRIALRVDPGAAFGSGRHESTFGCLQALDGLARRKRFGTMLDMGCGSGILALAMAHTWTGRVLAVDNDPRAVEIAGQNARLNRVGAQVTAALSQGYGSRRVKQGAPYDLIVANILANPLRKMAKDAKRSLEKGGRLVLAGFLTRDWRRVYSAHQMQGLRLEKRIDVGKWSTLVLKRSR